MRAAHKRWRHDTAAKLREITTASRRTVAYWTGRGRKQMSSDHLVALMRAAPTEFVPVVLGAAAYEALAREIVRQSRLEDLRKRQEAQRALIERLERGEVG